MTIDPELDKALRDAAPRLKPGMSVSQQIRELAIIGSQNVPDPPPDEAEMQRGLEGLVELFHDPEKGGLDWDLLRDGKADAWRFRK
ncbi:MAG: hypothetical protein ACTHN3_13660 [Solirubrobacterales bacterium]